MHCRRVAVFIALASLAGPAQAKLIVFDNSHASPYDFYDEFRSRLKAWGHTVESRTTPLAENGDADVIVILPEDAYTGPSEDYSVEEADWLLDFVAQGGGLLAAICPNPQYWMHIRAVMNGFGIDNANTTTVPAYYDHFAAHPIFEGIQALGDDVIYCTSLDVSPPSVAVADDGTYDYIAVYQPAVPAAGGAVWLSQYYMMSEGGLDDYDNLRFLQNALGWLSSGSTGAASSSWSQVKALYSR